MPPEGYFSQDTFDFLRELAQNNERPWFQSNKARYEQWVKDPLLDFIRDFSPQLKQLAPNFVAIPRAVGGSMFRIYRDIRFSEDKTPYKTWAAAHFRHRMHSKDVHGPGFYLHLEPENVFMGAGIWHPDTATLGRIREAIVQRPGGWIAAIGDDDFAENFTLEGDSLKRAPRGFDSDHPQIEHLKRKDFVASTQFSQAAACAPDFMGQFSQACGQASSFMRFLTEAVGLSW